MVSASNVAVLGGLGLVGAILFLKGGDIAKGIQDFFAGLNPATAVGNAAAGFGQAAGQGFNFYVQSQGELARQLSPAGQVENITNTFYTYATDYNKYKEIATNPATTNISIPTAKLVSTALGAGNSYYGATTYIANGAAIVQTAKSANTAATSYILGGGYKAPTQAGIATVLGVPASFIQSRQPATSTSAALIKYLK